MVANRPLVVNGLYHSPLRRSIPYRLGLDLGTNSIGWCVTDLGKPDKGGRMHPVRIRRMGVRIFPDGRDPQSGASLAQERRLPRSARRRRDRFLDRRAALMNLLIHHGLMPADPAERKALEALDPWRLRAEGLDRRLTLPELGRAIFHLNQRGCCPVGSAARCAILAEAHVQIFAEGSKTRRRPRV
jgi:CRISPR-associated endonuclease Csn1